MVRVDRSTSSKVDNFGTNRKHVLIRHCNSGPILHRFWDTATYWLKCLFFLPLSHSVPRSLCYLWNFAVKLTTRKLEPLGYPSVKAAWSQLESFWHDTGLWWTDRQTVRQRESIIASTALCWSAVKIGHRLMQFVKFLNLVAFWNAHDVSMDR